MNDRGNPATLRAAQPGNRNALKTGVYSARARAEHAAKIRAAADGISTVALVVAAVREECPRLDGLRQALDKDIAEHGPSTRSGAAREQFTQRSSVVRQLEKLESCWARGDLIDGAEIDGGLEEDPAAGAPRDQLLELLAHRDLLDLDLGHRGASTKKGGLRRQVADRVRVSRDVVRLADSIRTAIRRARSAVAPLSAWDVAREIAFDPSECPGDAIMAIRYLLTHPAPPPMKSPELLAIEAEIRTMSEEQIDAALAEAAAELEARRVHEDGGAGRNEQRATEPDGIITGCLELLRRIGDGADPRATARDRMSAVKLREHYLSRADPDPLRDELESWSEEDLDRNLRELLLPLDHDEC